MKKTKRSKKSRTWVIKQHRDQFFKKSKVLGYRSRAAFKLIEINKKFNFIKKNSHILDIGSTPGGWSQVASKIVTKGKILAVDRVNMEKIKNVTFIQEDFLEDKTKIKILVLSKQNIYSERNEPMFPRQPGYVFHCNRNMSSNKHLLFIYLFSHFF